MYIYSSNIYIYIFLTKKQSSIQQQLHIVNNQSADFREYVFYIFCIFFCISTLFEGDSEIGQLFQIYKVLGTPDDRSCECASVLVLFSLVQSFYTFPIGTPDDRSLPGVPLIPIESVQSHSTRVPLLPIESVRSHSTKLN